LRKPGRSGLRAEVRVAMRLHCSRGRAGKYASAIPLRCSSAALPYYLSEPDNRRNIDIPSGLGYSRLHEASSHYNRAGSPAAGSCRSRLLDGGAVTAVWAFTHAFNQPHADVLTHTSPYS